MVERCAKAIKAVAHREDDTDPDCYLRYARAAIEAMREPDEQQLDAVRRIVQWHGFERPTEAALMRHCKALQKDPPRDCRDVEHVPPTNMVSYWIYSGMLDAALREAGEKTE